MDDRLTLNSEGRFRNAVRTAIAASMAGSGMFSAAVQAQDSPETPGTERLEVLEVTGSRIRRVDLETASPIFTVDRATIQASGVTTLGELLQELPSIRGNATNPQVNNGGGDGASEISLRGLGEDRTLMLLNGRRLVTEDVNAIPVNFIERVEILNEGASAIYGSDAIAGVVNFITRRDFSGGELQVDYGISAESDGERSSVSLSVGMTTGRSNLLMGLNYNDQEKISAGDRDFARNALYLYGGTVYSFGSSRTPNGRIFLPDTDPGTPGVQDPFGFNCSTGSVTRIAGATGDATTDYRCFGNEDFYNYQPLNLVLTPQERVGLFTVGNYQLTDNIEGYTELFHNRTQSGFQIAPLPFDARNDQVILSADSVYNPFGIDFGGPGDLGNPQFLTRLEALGNRRNEIETATSQLNLGLRGNVFDTTWRWDLSGTYGRADQEVVTSGYLYQPALAAALGPSFDAADNDPTADADGDGNPIDDPRCGTFGSPIDGCIPVNFFNLTDPASQQALNAITASYSNGSVQTLQGASLNFSGDLVTLPAGNVAAAVGVEYREERLQSRVDFVATALPPDYLNCYLAQETCSTPTNGSYDVREYYGEAFVPILSNVPGAEALNAIVGVRHSDYSNFGDTTNGKIGLEYRPIADLLARATISEVFRAPTIVDLYSPPASNAPTFNDPCTGLTAADVAANPNLALACENVPTDGTYAPENSQVTGLLQGNPNLDPETGEVYTWGLVYDPAWLPNFSARIDFWRYALEDTIETLDVNTIADQCIATGDPTFCGYIQRFPDGQVNVIDQPTANLGAIDARGVDLGLAYRFDAGGAGRFRFSIDTSYIDQFERTADKNFPDQVDELAGTFDRQDGNFARVRGTGRLDWALAGFEALWASRYFGGFRVEDPDGSPGIQPDRHYGSRFYHDFTLGYNLLPAGLRFQLGVNNAFDKQPPVLFQNNVLNANTDVETFDTVGRFYWARIIKNF